jgi:hypothetical protein
MAIYEAQFQRLLLQRDAAQQHPWRAAIGSSSAALTVVTNVDGTFPYIRKTSVKDNQKLALLPDYEETQEYYRVTVVGTTPNPSAQWWLNTGYGYRRVKHIEQVRRAVHWWVVLCP